MNTQTKIDSSKSSRIDGTSRSSRSWKQFKARVRSKQQEMTKTQFLRRMTRWSGTVTKYRVNANNEEDRHTKTPRKHTPHEGKSRGGIGALHKANREADRHKLTSREKHRNREHNEMYI